MRPTKGQARVASITPLLKSLQKPHAREESPSLEIIEPRNPNYGETVRAIFSKAPFVAELGIELVDCGPGWCETRMSIAQRHTQQNGLVHAGVVATIADHTAGASAGTVMAADVMPLTVEYKINLMRAGAGEALRCRAEVLRAGSTLTVSESSVYAVANGEERLIAKALVTLALVPSG